jgi:hypothetical protein
MTTITVKANEVSQPVKVGAGSIVTITPTSSVLVEYNKGTLSDITNGSTPWASWPKGTVTVETSQITNKQMWVRVKPTGGIAVLQTTDYPATALAATYERDWAGNNMPYVLAQSAVPYGIANSGTVATNGTYTAGTAYNTTYSGGIWLYFPATAFATASAGFYWCVASSTTAFQVYTDATAATLITGSNSGFTGSTSQQTAVSVTLPGGVVGANGKVRIAASSSCNATAGQKSMQFALGATNLTIVNSASVLAINSVQTIANRNSLSRQRLSNFSSATGSGGYATIDTSADQTISIKLTLAVATDVVVLEDYTIEVMPA